MKDTFRALLAEKSGDAYSVAFRELRDEDLPEGEVLVEVSHSSLNYKDGLAVTGAGRIIRKFPMVPGIDLAGTVLESTDSEFTAGQRVVAVGQGLGELAWGGYAQRQRVSADALVPLPPDLTAEEAMQIGTAGFTAMLCVQALERHGITPSDRPLVVTGAAGGVGSIGVLLLAGRGFRVAASTGRPEQEAYLRDLGATEIIARDELAKSGAPMQSERWGGGIDTVGGATLANLYAQTAYEGAIACCGMAGGHELTTAVWPLILRGVSLLGVSSIRPSKAKRVTAWDALSRELDRKKLAALSTVEPLSRIEELSRDILAGKIRGRIVIDVNA